MNNKIYLNAGIALLAGLGLVACNGGNSSSTGNNTAQTSELQQYINSLAYTPAGGKQLTGSVVTRQQSFTTPGGLTIDTVDIKFYSGPNCTESMVYNQTLNGPVTPLAGTYTSTNASNNALCTAYTNATVSPTSSGCSGLYTDMSKGNMRSVQYTYHLSSGTDIIGGCMYNPNAVVTIGEDTTTGVEGIANWTDVGACSGSGNTTCGYSQAYSTSLTERFAYVLGTDKIYGFNYNSSTGELTANGSISSYGTNSVGIINSKDGKYLYVVDSTQSMIKSFAVNSNTGALTFIESITTGNSPSNGSLSFDPSGNYLYSSAAGAQNITVFSYDSSTGHLTQKFTVASGAHPSFMSFTPNGSYLYVSNDYGVVPITEVSDYARINMYSVQANGNLVALTPESSIKSLANNPYFSVVDPSGKYLYVANVGPISAGLQYAESSLTVFSINQSTGALSYNSAQSLVTVGSAPVSLVTDSVGKYLYVANGLSQTISQLSINSVDGSVSSLTPSTANFGLTPVSLVFSPDRKFIYTVSQYGNFIKYYNQDPLTGQLNATGSQISTGSTSQSVYLVFNN